MSQVEHRAARASTTLPFRCLGERAYIKLESDLEELFPNALQFQQEVGKHIEVRDNIEKKMAARETERQQENKPAVSSTKSDPNRLYDCYGCKQKIKFGKDKQKLNPDGTPHICLTKPKEIIK